METRQLRYLSYADAFLIHFELMGLLGETSFGVLTEAWLNQRWPVLATRQCMRTRMSSGRRLPFVLA